MVFSSVYFLLYFLPVFLLLYFCSPQRWKNTTALLASCFFYAWGAPDFFFVVLFSLVIDFYLVRLTLLSQGRLRRLLLAMAVALNIGTLLLMKYLNFFIENANVVLHTLDIGGIDLAKIVLPIGISFITFQKLSYVIDCYQKKVKPLDNLFDYMLYILLFPQLIAGPIVRFKEVVDQLKDRTANETIDHKLEGLFRFVTGLAKKVLMANALGILVDQVFGMAPGDLNSGLAWIGIIAYSFQIYFDFSGYSDMAIGIALMLGFRFPENFNLPYSAQSITDFWRRWHITLSNWMKDYLYIPLGGNRVSKRRLYLNLWLVFLISGFWHGAAWTFIIWGAWHGLFLVLERLFLKNWWIKIGKLPSILGTYLIVLIGWVFFRSGTLTYALDYLGRMFSFDFSIPAIYIDTKFWIIFGLASVFVGLGFFNWVERNASRWYRDTKRVGVLGFKSLVTVVLAWMSLVSIFASDFNPFIYFKF